MKDVTTRYVVTGLRFVCQEGLRIDTLMKTNVQDTIHRVTEISYK